MVSKLEVGGLGGQPSAVEATIEASGNAGLEPASIASEIVSTTISAATAPSFSKSRDGIKFFSSGARPRPRLFQPSQALANPLLLKQTVMEYSKKFYENFLSAKLNVMYVFMHT